MKLTYLQRGNSERLILIYKMPNYGNGNQTGIL